ncbi:SH3 domain-containing protein [Thiotrichales bacterium HSG1]|nr:SH3 domain-containing protein [Thiotrichales bacterium HSG1]
MSDSHKKLLSKSIITEVMQEQNKKMLKLTKTIPDTLGEIAKINKVTELSSLTSNTGLQNPFHNHLLDKIRRSSFAQENNIAKQLHNLSISTITQLTEEKFAKAVPDYVTAMDMAIGETTVFDSFKSLTNIGNITSTTAALVNHTDIFRDLLKPLSYLEEQTKMIGIEAIGKDAFSVTAFSAIHAIESQFKFHHLTQEAFLKTPLYDLLSKFDGLYPEDFETKEDWYDAALERAKKFLITNIEQSKKYSSSIVHYFAKNTLEFFGIALAIYSITQSPSLQNVQDIKQKINDGQIQSEERDKRLLKKFNEITEILKKSNNCPIEKLPPSEIKNYYRVINDIEVKSEPSTTSASINILTIGTQVEVFKKQDNGWVQIEFSDYIYNKTRKGWIKMDDVEPLITESDEEETATTPLRLAEASDRIHERYAKTFQRLADE